MIDPDKCDHPAFDEKTQKCTTCGISCEHWNTDDGFCMDCGMAYEDNREPPDEDYTDYPEDNKQVS